MKVMVPIQSERLSANYCYCHHQAQRNCHTNTIL